MPIQIHSRLDAAVNTARRAEMDRQARLGDDSESCVASRGEKSAEVKFR